MIEIEGDLFDFIGKAEWLCITTNGTIKTNGQGVMGRGCALEAKKRWPEIDEILGRRLRQVGNIATPLTREGSTIIWSFPVKHNWDEKADLELIKKSAEKLVQIIGREKFDVVIPRPGCGNGHLRWEDVKPVLAPLLDDRFKIVTNEGLGKVVSITGHRPEKLGGYDDYNPTQIAVMQRLEDAFRRLRPSKVITGMALGVDQWTAEICVDLKLPFLAAVPFEGFDSKWPEKSRRRFETLLAKASEVVYVSRGVAYHPGLLQVRNEWMVDHADRVVAVWDGTDGGTANCVRYAQKARKPVLFLDPR